MSELFFKEIKRLENDKTSGAMEIAEKVLLILKEEIKKNFTFWDNYSINEKIEQLLPIININKNMIILRNLVLEFLSLLENGVELEKIPSMQLEKLNNSKKILAQNISKRIFEEKTIITFSRASTLLESLRVGKKLYEHPLEVIIFESSPKKEGKTLAEELLKIGHRVRYSFDAAMKIMFEKYKPTLAIIGADSIFPQGEVVNKTGSYILAKLAKEYDIPFIVGATMKKVMLKEINVLGKITSSESSELWNKDYVPNLEVVDVHFEKIPRALLNGFISEKGFSKKPIGEKYSLSENVIKKVYS
ncbi:MAG: hypothetical protein K9W46_01350 [Candidatus Heimdallarchaeum endolithica]|uniref:Initiation factor 2B n=1 Tax=Candidatus Heimdallarchaeum endolithica TaxID=2876572 RepID=A0A9Y1BRC9_9ARCH|nr:MAG: hypothetical protein K9W46_01350 [Candidatus Heimdallarchaeum endolithica]